MPHFDVIVVLGRVEAPPVQVGSLGSILFGVLVAFLSARAIPPQ
jgi:hypothetical protein